MHLAFHLVASLALIHLSTPALSQSFEPGDLYIYTPAFDGISSSDGAIAHINPDTGTVTKFLDFSTSNGRRDQIAYDPFRDRLIFQGGFIPNHTELYLADATGHVTSLGFGGVAGPGANGFAPRGDGNIYFLLSSAFNEIQRLDQADVVSPLLNATGTAPYNPTGWHGGFVYAMEYHPPTNSLVLGFTPNQGLCAGGSIQDISLRRLNLSPDGTRVVSESCWQYDFDPGNYDGEVVGLANMPNGKMLMTIDNNSNGTYGRMVLVDPAAMSGTPFAYNGYPTVGAAATNAGTFSHVRNQAVILDSFNDVLRGFGFGETGAGTIFAPGVSYPGSSGEVATLIEVGTPTSGFVMTATPLALSGSAGGAQGWTMDFGPALAGNFYLVLGSRAGWTPSTNYGGVPVPLIADMYTVFTINHANGPNYPGSLGQLDALGRASANLVVPPALGPSFIGITAYHATLAFTPGLAPLGATNAVPVTIQ